MTGEEAAVALKAGVEALFAEARGGDREERCAYIEAGGSEDLRRYVYVAFSNGYMKPQGEPVPFRDLPLPEMVEMMIAAAATEFPDHASQGMIWRTEPDYNLEPPIPEDNAFEWPARPAHHSLWMRLVAVPIGTHGNCTFCGVLHHESQPHFLTERAIEEIVWRSVGKGRKEFMSK